MIANLFTTVLYEPLLNALVGLYVWIPNLGVAILLLTVGIKLLLWRPSISALKAQKSNLEIQPKIKALQARYKGNREEMGRQLMALYKQHKVSPLSSLGPLLLQFPILIALFQVFNAGLQTDPATHTLVQGQLDHLYGGIRAALEGMTIAPTFLGMNLAAKGNVVLAVLAGALQFWQSRMLVAPKPAVRSDGAKDEALTAATTRQMMYFMPVITVVFGYQFPAGLALYWVASTALAVAQQYYFLRRHGPLHPLQPGSPVPAKVEVPKP